MVTDKEYQVEVAKLMMSGEWLPLQYLAAYLNRQQLTIKTWAKNKWIDEKYFGEKRTNMYNVEQAIGVDKKQPRHESKISRKEAKAARMAKEAERVEMQSKRQKYYAAMWEEIMEKEPLCWNYEECKNPSNEIAHIVANTKSNHTCYGWWAVNHRDNVRQSCRCCNDKAMSLVRGDAARKRHMDKIYDKLKAEGIDPWKGRK